MKIRVGEPDELQTGRHCEEFEKFGQALERVAVSVDQPTVLTVEGPWGVGKTTFLREWRTFLVNKGYLAVYLDAWQTDVVEEPLFCVLIELEKAIREFGGKQTRKDSLLQNLDTLKRVGAVFARYGLRRLSELATAGVTNQEFWITAGAAMNQARTGVRGVAAREQPDEYTVAAARLEAMGEFRTALTNITASLGESKGQGKPLVVIVDELDRCRPDYALKMLECIKHLFRVKHVIFVLGCDLEHLASQVEVIYGPKIDGLEYLDRLIDLRCRLPEVPLGAFVNSVLDEMNLRELLSTRFGSTSPGEFLGALLDVPKSTLRRKGKLAGRIALLAHLDSTASRHELLAGAMALVLLESERDMFENLLKRGASVKDGREWCQRIGKMSVHLESPSGALMAYLSVEGKSKQDVVNDRVKFERSGLATGVIEHYITTLEKLIEQQGEQPLHVLLKQVLSVAITAGPEAS